ncbi:MAG: M20 family metallopeptidase [Cytophagales bacterium]|nr:M20 family metallopeptidase [Cytophagales bacterium]
MISVLASSIMNHLDQCKEEMSHLLEKLSRLESPSTVKESQPPVLKLISIALWETGYEARHYPGKNTGGFLLASPVARRKGRPLQLLLGHGDTVWPLNTVQEMPVGVKDGKMYGPGVYDMKAGIVQIIYALKTIRELRLNYTVTPVVLINTDEEIGSHESRAAIRRLAAIADRAFVLEPSLGPAGRLKTTRKGIGRFNIIVKGKAAHAGLEPGKGASAIVALSEVIQQLFKLNNPERGISVNVGMIEGGISPNVVAPESKAVVDVRVPTQKEATEITEKIQNLKSADPDITIEVSGKIGRPPMEATPRNLRLWDQAKKAASALNIPISQAQAGGGSDGNITSLYTATLDGLGAVGSGAHAIHENVALDKMPERTALLTLLLLSEPVTSRNRN